MAKQAKQKNTFTYIAPTAKKVELVADFTGWQEAPLPMKKSKGGTWTRAVSLVPGRYEYRLLVDGEWRDDPHCPDRQPNQFGGENCVRVVEVAPKASANERAAVAVARQASC
jgi:1,4-alpha-glucan branching enzyme